MILPAIIGIVEDRAAGAERPATDHQSTKLLRPFRSIYPGSVDSQDWCPAKRCEVLRSEIIADDQICKGKQGVQRIEILYRSSEMKRSSFCKDKGIVARTAASSIGSTTVSSVCSSSSVRASERKCDRWLNSTRAPRRRTE